MVDTGEEGTKRVNFAIMIFRTLRTAHISPLPAIKKKPLCIFGPLSLPLLSLSSFRVVYLTG